MKHRRNTILWAIGWWIVRRQVRRRAAVAFADVGAAAQRGRFRAVLGAVVLVGLLAGAFVAARKLRCGREAAGGAARAGRPGRAGRPTRFDPGPAAA